MPIIVELLNQATSQDRQDLQKIYRDAPDWLFAPFSGEAQLIEDCLRDGTLIAGRFNDRLLGAARLQRHQDAWYLSQICVRKITRRRGVAERLVARGSGVVDAERGALAQGEGSSQLCTPVESISRLPPTYPLGCICANGLLKSDVFSRLAQPLCKACPFTNEVFMTYFNRGGSGNLVGNQQASSDEGIGGLSDDFCLLGIRE